jgi:UDP-glucose 4-epimerase
MMILVTGGAGFIGSHIIEMLLGRHEVICLDNFDAYYNVGFKKKNIEPFLANENFKLVEGSILDKRLLRELIEGVEYIFHNAAQPGVRASVNDPLKAHEVNATGTLNVLKAALDSDVKKVINASSSSVYGEVMYLPFDEKHPTRPVSPYGVSKLAAEHYCRVFQEVYGLNTVSLRYFTVFGPHMRPDLAISIFIGRALKNEPIEIFGDGEKTRDFTYIHNIVEANLLAMKKGKGEYNIGSGKRISVNDLVRKIISLTGSSSKIIHMDSVQGDAMHTWADIEKARKELGYRPEIDLDEGLEKFLRWYKETNV